MDSGAQGSSVLDRGPLSIFITLKHGFMCVFRPWTGETGWLAYQHIWWGGKTLSFLGRFEAQGSGCIIPLYPLYPLSMDG